MSGRGTCVCIGFKVVHTCTHILSTRAFMGRLSFWYYMCIHSTMCQHATHYCDNFLSALLDSLGRDPVDQCTDDEAADRPQVLRIKGSMNSGGGGGEGGEGARE